MILLDSDHLTALKYRGSERYVRLTDRLQAAGEPIGTTIINVEEQMRGWLASLAKERDVLRQVPAYRELEVLFEFFSKFHVASFDTEAATRFHELRTTGVKIGTMDLKVACITLVHSAVLLTANRRDFEKVPGLHFENWLDRTEK
jgi:tRNA(fMet)-specific endonuclease VapC